MTSTVKEIHLSVLDQSIYRQYEKNLVIFPFEDISNADAAIKALRTGLSSAFYQLPFLAGTLKLSDPSPGLLRAFYSIPTRRDHGDAMLTTSMALATHPEFDYTVMERSGFPPAMLPSSAFCPLGLRSHAGLEHPYAEGSADAARGYRLPIMCSQATFIPGGLVLSVYTHHSVVDWKGIVRLLEEWSRGTSCCEEQAQNIDVLDEQDGKVVDTSIVRLALDATAHKSLADIVTDCPEITTSLTKLPIKPLLPGRYHLQAKVLSIPTARVLALRSELQGHTSVRISTFITIAALMWTHITRARSEALNVQGHSSTTLGIVVDTRKRLNNAIFKDAMGNMSLFAATLSSIPAMLRSIPDLVSTAISISSAIDAVDESW